MEVFIINNNNVPNFNFIVSLVSEIWRESQNKILEAADFHSFPLADNFYIEPLYS